MALASSSSLGGDISTSPQVPQPHGAVLFSPNSRAIAGFGSPAGDVFKSASVCIKSNSSSGRWSSGHLSDGPDSPRKDITIGAAIAVSEDGNGYVGADVSPLVICFGEMLIDFVPTSGGISLAEAPAFKKAPGGAPANVAVGIARLGGRSAFIGKVGQDEFGYMLADILRQNNVEDRGIRFDPAARTALAFVTLRSDGEREFMFYRNPSADMLLHEKELDDHLIKEATIFHYGSISLITEPCKTAHMSAMKKAKEAGALLSYDPNLRLPLWPSEKEAREGILSIWNEADVIKVSEDEIAFLTEGGDPYSDEIAMQFMHSNLKLLLVTEGKNGCRYYTKDFKGRVDGMRVKTVDTTGAGDAFVAGLLSQLVSDLSLLEDEKRLRDALLFANGCGAITTTERGAIPALPDREAVLNLISNCEVLA